METHIVGANHWKKLGNHFQWCLPPPDEARDTSQPWVEKIQTPRGPYFFNHVTGDLLDQAGEPASVPPALAAHPANPPPSLTAVYPSTAMPPPYPQGHPPLPKSAPQSLNSDASTMVPPSTPTMSTVSSAQGNDGAYMAALMDKGKWRLYMEPLAKVAEAALTRTTGTWDYACPVCQQPNTRGMADHIPSQTHWKKLGERLEWCPPSVESVGDLTQAWVQKIPARSGTFYFNHLTGAHHYDPQAALEDVRRPAAAPSPVVAGPVAPNSGAISAPVGPPAPPGRAGFNHAHWLWANTVRVAAGQVEEITSHPSFQGPFPTCSVCVQPSSPLSRDHLLSLGHFQMLQSSLASAAIPEDLIQRAIGGEAAFDTVPPPFFQILELDGQQYQFNHITGKELWTS